MKTLALSKLAAVTMAAPLLVGTARADGGGDGRMPAGGAHMSSYVHHPYHDPRSSHSQVRGTGQLLGAPMVAERPATGPALRDSGTRRWAVQPPRR
ncbi:hypothetical protein SAMN04487843_103153 [Methylobacterium sp. ap11]|uniref:hypothetical protein n=1 Tax=Methylobacterium sp. ap11 TaxID=1761799 RepID=UPI0008C42642|nr:hypothetical protein [Methylobacterium sp. ap11]SEO70899.1 hypothetical protein SAMN04487843_103153 [Methylobacterium sp. ap11]